MREIAEVADRVLAEVPKDYLFLEDMIADINKLKRSVLYTAPEMMPFRWRQLMQICERYLERPDTDWKKSIDEIMRDLK